MEKSKITIHRALAELKLIDKKINTNLSSFTPIGIKQEGKLVNDTYDVVTFSNNAISKYQTIVDLVERKSAIKKAIMESNAINYVTIAGKRMTIIDAINYKETAAFLDTFCNVMQQDVNKAISRLTKHNESILDTARNNVAIMLGAEGASRNDASVEGLMEPYLKRNNYTLVDPLNVEKKIETIRTDVDDFRAEVDAALSESNAITYIEI